MTGKPIKQPGPDHPITIGPDSARVRRSAPDRVADCLARGARWRGLRNLRRAEQSRDGGQRAQGTLRRRRRNQHHVAIARAIHRRLRRSGDIRVDRARRSFAARGEPRAAFRRGIYRTLGNYQRRAAAAPSAGVIRRELSRGQNPQKPSRSLAKTPPFKFLIACIEKISGSTRAGSRTGALDIDVKMKTPGNSAS